MKKIDIAGKEYYKTNTLEVNQKENRFYISTLKAPQLEFLCALEPMDYYKKISTKKTKKLQELLMKYESSSETSEEGFNRDVNPTRINEVSDFIMNEEYAMLPNSIIVSSKLKNSYFSDDELFDPENCDDQSWLKRFNSNKGIYVYKNIMYIPNEANSFLVIDGQHRLLGFDSVDEEIKKDYDLIVSVLAGIDNSVMAKVFYTINFNQKPVNKSVLTYLTHEFSDDLSEAKLLHEYIRIMNKNSSSPFQNKIKLLGVGEGYVSLAFLHEKLLPLFLKTGEKSNKIPIFRDLYETNQVYILNSILRYFTAVVEILGNKWENKTSVLTKTIGIGALIEIFPQVILATLTDHSSSAKINDIKVADYKRTLKQLTLDESSYSKAGGLGTLGRIRDDLLEYLSIEDFNKKFVESKKIEWIKKYYVKDTK